MPTMSMIVKERRLWRELVQAHFTNLQIEFILSRYLSVNLSLCQSIYHIKKSFNLTSIT